MNTKQMLEDFWKDVMEVRTSDIHNETICIVTDDNMKDYTRKLIESVAEEIVGENESEEVGYGIGHEQSLDNEKRNDLRAEQRLKVKEILSNLK